MKLHKCKTVCFFAGCLFVWSVFSGCASKPRFSGRGDLCGVVIDENNHPVSDYIISCRKDLGIWQCSMTNSQGIFVFSDVPYGKYSFKGSKEYFADFEDKNYVFNDCGKVFCFQLSTMDLALDNADKLIAFEDFSGAMDLLKRINCKKKTPGWKVLQVYKSYVAEEIKKQKEEKKKNG